MADLDWPAALAADGAQIAISLARRSVFVPHHDMDRIALTRADLETTIGVWIATAGIQRPAAVRDLWTRKDELRDVAKREAARRALAEFIAERMVMSGWELTRRAIASADPARQHDHVSFASSVRADRT